MRRGPEYTRAAVSDFITSPWLLLFDYVTTGLSQIEWEFEVEHFSDFVRLGEDTAGISAMAVKLMEESKRP